MIYHMGTFDLHGSLLAQKKECNGLSVALKIDPHSLAQVCIGNQTRGSLFGVEGVAERPLLDKNLPPLDQGGLFLGAV